MRLGKIGLVIALLLALHRSGEAQSLSVKNWDAQTVKGWGVFPSYHHSTYWGAGWDILSRTGVQNALYRDLGANWMRVELVPGFYNGSSADRLAYNGSTPRIDGLRQHIARARAIQPGIKYMVSIWTPPSNLKNPMSEDGNVGGVATHLVGYGTGNNYSALTSQEEEFCQWVLAGLKYLKNTVGAPAALCIQNEPTYAPGYMGCVYDGYQWARVTKRVKQLLNANAIGTELLAAEGNTYRDNKNLLWDKMWLLKDDTTLGSAVGGLATHSYDVSWADQPAMKDIFYQWEQTLSVHTNRDIWMTEWCTEDGTNVAPTNSPEIIWAINASRHLAREMVCFRTNYWFWWMGWGKNVGAGQLLSGDVTGTTAPNKTKTYHVLSRLWKNVPSGSLVRWVDSSTWHFQGYPWVDTGSTSWQWEVDAVAFKTPSGKMAMLIVNKTGSSFSALPVSGLLGTAADVYVTSASQNDVKTSRTLSGGSLTINLPAQSVAVVVTR
jgi:O-glycosyl hydrolase